jgi:integrase
MATIRKRGDRWHVQIRRKGAKPLTRSFLHKRDAERWARDNETAIDQSRLPPDPKALERITLGELVLRYRDTISIRKRAPDQERINLTAFLRHSICAKRLSELKTSDFAVYRDERLREIKPTTVKRILSPVRHLFKIAKREWGLPIVDNPLDELEIKSPDNKRERRLKASELEKLIDAATLTRNPLILPIVLLALETGMRRGEILSVCGQDIDIDQRTLRIRQSKNGHPRTIPLTAKAIELLQPFMKKDERLFPISPNALRLSWDRLRQRAGLTGLHFHDLRHEAISRFFEKGLTIPEAALLSGHQDARMLFR